MHSAYDKQPLLCISDGEKEKEIKYIEMARANKVDGIIGVTFSDVEEMLHRYKTEKGLKICCWINPYIAQGTDFFREGLEHGYFVMRKDGKGPRQLDFWQPGMALVDFTNPAATMVYR